MALFAFKCFFLSFFSVLFLPATQKPFLSISKDRHPFFVSVTEINHNNKEKTLEIACKIFVDDMEATLQQNYKTAINLSSPNDEEKLKGFIKDYINKHLKIIVDGKAVVLNFIGFEKENEAVYCYFEAVNITAIKKLDVENSLLQDYTDKQINILHVIVNGKRQSTQLDAVKVAESFKF